MVSGFILQLFFPSVDSTLRIWAVKNNCKIKPDTIQNSSGIVCTKWTAISGNGDIELYTIASWAHGWPVQSSAGISATDKIWDFFVNHPKQIQTISTDFTEINNNGIIVFPNPTTGLFTIFFGTTPIIKANVEIFNLQGKKILSVTFRSDEITIDLSGYPKGIYIAKLW